MEKERKGKQDGTEKGGQVGRRRGEARGVRERTRAPPALPLSLCLSPASLRDLHVLLGRLQGLGGLVVLGAAVRGGEEEGGRV